MQPDLASPAARHLIYEVPSEERAAREAKIRFSNRRREFAKGFSMVFEFEEQAAKQSESEAVQR